MTHDRPVPTRTKHPLGSSLAGGLLGMGVAGLAVLALAAAEPRSAPARLQEGLRVSGRGEVEIRPERLVVRVWLEGKSEVAADAQEAWLQARARAGAAFEAAGIEGLTVAPQGPSIEYSPGMGDDMAMRGFIIAGQQQEVESKVSYREQLQLVVEGVGDLDAAGRGALVARVLDTALDAGLELEQSNSMPNNVFYMSGSNTSASEPQGLVSWEVSEVGALEEAAAAAALEDARRRAQALAELAGVALGSVQSLDVTYPSSAWSTAAAQQAATARAEVVFGVQ